MLPYPSSTYLSLVRTWSYDTGTYQQRRLGNVVLSYFRSCGQLKISLAKNNEKMNFGGQPAGSAITLSKLCVFSEPISSSEKHRNP